MIRLWFAPRTRAVRIVWLLEELGLPYELERVDFQTTANAFFTQKTPSGKIPVLEDDGVVMSESGAIVEFLLERYGEGRLAPAPGTPERARYLQWLHFAESTAYPPVGIVVWLVVYRGEAESQAELVADARARARSGFDHLEAELGDGPWLLGEDFTAADVMMGFTVAAARLLAVIDDASHPRIAAYFGRLAARPAFAKAAALA